MNKQIVVVPLTTSINWLLHQDEVSKKYKGFSRNRTRIHDTQIQSQTDEIRNNYSTRNDIKAKYLWNLGRRIQRTSVFIEVLIAIDENDGIQSVDNSRNITEKRQQKAYTKLNLQPQAIINQNYIRINKKKKRERERKN